jgi:DNA polymerase III delta prime subunit
MCKNRPLELKGHRGYKVLLLNEVDRLSREAQHSLRRTMEKYSATCRLIFSCSNVSKVSPPTLVRRKIIFSSLLDAAVPLLSVHL